MLTNTKIMIVGAGRFAKNYIDVLDALNRRSRATGDVPAVRTLILTRSRSETARDQARRISEDTRYAFEHVAGVRVRDTEQLIALLERERPGLVCITARDPVIGDRIHALYAPAALTYAPVLCEKPFDIAAGDGASLAVLDQLKQHANAGAFGLHLPMAVVRDAMMADRSLRTMITEAGDLEFLWQKTGPSRDLASDLGLHPWSLIASAEPPEVQSVELSPDRVRVDFFWKTAAGDRPRNGRMILETGGRFRAMRVGENVFSFDFAGGKLLVRRHKAPWPEITGSKEDRGGNDDVVLSVDNPLEQHLLAALRGRPLAGISQAYAAQQFLEKLNGFKP